MKNMLTSHEGACAQWVSLWVTFWAAPSWRHQLVSQSYPVQLGKLGGKCADDYACHVFQGCADQALRSRVPANVKQVSPGTGKTCKIHCRKVA